MSFEGINFKRLLHGANDTPLTVEEERKLIRRYRRGSKKARDRLIESNQRFIIRLALRMRGQGLPLVDLIQEGNLGLIEALERFDPGRNCRLISYASWWIRLYMQRGIEYKSRPVNIPVNKISLLKKIKSFEHTFSKSNGRLPTLEEISAEIGIPENKAESILALSGTFLSIDCADEEGTSLEDLLHFHIKGAIHRKVWLEELRDRIFRVLECLTPKERAVILHRFGLSGLVEPTSLRQVGLRLGLSAEGVRQIQQQALQKLRTADDIYLLEGFLSVA
ncbi:MAG TPA: RNA polymerase sigma factor RpoD/SigA [bacterium]|nr:RNA polymerase sigma factor RpoD/SigA [bacterium]HQL60786.1 RNA polymerase sigma factor RpoD/SigA [bacterium]